MSGCTSTGAQGTHYRGIPERPPRITFVRNQNNSRSPIITTVAINDWIVGTLAPGEHLSIQHEPGLHYVTVKGTTVPLTFRNNREYFFLVDQDSNGATRAIRPIYGKDAAPYMESPDFHTSR
ncbi:MAG: hypothetical protein R3208_09205 [Ketobacteraceae bacterium]|nr:hypothetical protein [Ketobacteraceae bacterium]